MRFISKVHLCIQLDITFIHFMSTTELIFIFIILMEYDKQKIYFTREASVTNYLLKLYSLAFDELKSTIVNIWLYLSLIG